MSWSKEAAEIVDALRALPGVSDARAACLATSSNALHAAAETYWGGPDGERESWAEEHRNEGWDLACAELSKLKLSKAAREAISSVLDVEWTA